MAFHRGFSFDGRDPFNNRGCSLWVFRCRDSVCCSDVVSCKQMRVSHLDSQDFRDRDKIYCRYPIVFEEDILRTLSPWFLSSQLVWLSRPLLVPFMLWWPFCNYKFFQISFWPGQFSCHDCFSCREFTTKFRVKASFKRYILESLSDFFFFLNLFPYNLRMPPYSKGQSSWSQNSYFFCIHTTLNFAFILFLCCRNPEGSASCGRKLAAAVPRLLQA